MNETASSRTRPHPGASRRALLGALCLAAAFASPLRAQEGRSGEKVRFSVDHDLAGFEAAQWSDAADLYPFADYKELDGKEMTREEFDAVVAKWKGERERVAKEVAQLATDPALRSKRRLHKKVANHPFLSRLELVENLSFAPVLIVVQRPPKAKPGFDEAVAQTHGPWLKRAVDTFEEEWKETLPPRREGCALLPVLFLASYGDFVNYCKTASGGAYNGAAHFNADLQAVVCYTESMGATRDETIERRASIYGLVHSLIQSHASSNDATSSQWWLREGLARLYSNWGGDAKAPLVAQPDDKGLLWLGGVISNDHKRELYFMPVEELLAVKSANDLYPRMETRLGETEVADADWGYNVRGAFAVECGLLVADLMRADGGKQRPLLAARLATLFAPTKNAGGPIPPSLDPGALQKQLAATLQAELKRVKSPIQIDEALKGSLATWKPKHAGGEAAPKGDSGSDVVKAATGLSGGVDAGPFDPAILTAEPLPPEARLGIALRLAAIGEFDAAAWNCEEIAKTLEESDPQRERVTREARRLHDLSQWRKEFVDAWKTGGKKLRIEHDGSSTTGLVKGIEENDLVLLDAKGRDLRLSLAALDSEQILRRMSEGKLEVGTPLVRAYAALIAGRKVWAKGLAGATPEETTLKSDGARWPDLLAQGDVAARLQKLAHATLPANSTQATAPLLELRALLTIKEGKEGKEVAAIVEPRRAALRAFAGICFRRQFDAVGIAAAGLKGRILSKPDGTVRVTYTFDDPAELDDFVVTSPKVWDSRQLDRIKLPANRAAAKVENGSLRILGTKLWLSKLQFRAPMTVDYKYRAPTPADDDPITVATLCITLCDDGRRSRVTATDMGGLRIDETGFADEDYDPQAWEYDAAYENRIAHDGKQVTFVHVGEKEHRVPARGRQFGRVGIFACTETWLEIDELEIEGHVDEASLEPLRAAWVDLQVGALERGEWKPPKGEKPAR